MSFIKLYDDNEQDGYITSRNIHYFDVEFNEGNYPGDAHYIVRACLEDENLKDGYQVSPKIDDREEAYLFLDSIIEKLRGSDA